MIKISLQRIGNELEKMSFQYAEINTQPDVTQEIIELNKNLVSACNEVLDMLKSIEKETFVDVREIKKIAEEPKTTYGRYVQTVSNWLASRIESDALYDNWYLNNKNFDLEIR